SAMSALCSDIRDTWSCGSITSSSPPTWHALTVQNRFAPMGAGVCFPTLGVPGAPELPCRLSSRLESSCSIFGCHSDGRLNVRQTASRCRRQHRGSCGLLVRKLTNGQPVVVTKRQVPPNKPTAYAFEEVGNGCPHESL